MIQENFVIVENSNQEDLGVVLSALAGLYGDTGFIDEIELFQHNTQGHNFLINFKDNPDIERFAYFTNYIHYPAGFNAWTANVTGYYKVKSNESTTNFKAGELLQIYVSQSDTEYDNVSIVNSENKSFLLDFGGKTKLLTFTEKKYHHPEIEKSNYNLVRIITPNDAPAKESKKAWWKFW